MNQRHWIYVGPYRRQNRIGLMHGTASGNLMVYYNDKIVLIDFKVFDSKSYKFFIDDELCEVSVIRQRRGYRYAFLFDTKTQTPLNQSRKKSKRKDTRKGLALIIGVPLLIGLVIFGYIQFRKGYLERKFRNHAKTEWATVRILNKGVRNYYEHFHYFKNEEGEYVQSRRETHSKSPTTTHGLPLENGDVFAMRYIPEHDFYHKINYDEPDPETAVRMIRRVAERHINNHQGQVQKDLFCEVQAAFDVAGMKGLADIYNQTASKTEQPERSGSALTQLTSTPSFQKAYEECRGE